MSNISKLTLANLAMVYLQCLKNKFKLVDIMIIPNLIIRHTDKVDLVYSYMVSIALACNFGYLGYCCRFQECGLSTSLIQDYLSDHYIRRVAYALLINRCRKQKHE